MNSKETYFEWAQYAQQPGAIHAWNHQQKKINTLIGANIYLEDNMAKAICSGKDRLKMTIYELNEYIKQNLAIIEELEKENKELKGKLNEQENIGTKLTLL